MKHFLQSSSENLIMLKFYFLSLIVEKIRVFEPLITIVYVRTYPKMNKDKEDGTISYLNSKIFSKVKSRLACLSSTTLRCKIIRSELLEFRRIKLEETIH